MASSATQDSAGHARRTASGLAFRALARLGLVPLYQPVPWLGLDAGKRGRATEARWEAMRRELPDGISGSALDVGCQLGYFTFRLAEAGYHSHGVEGGRRTVRCAKLIRRATGLRNAEFACMTLDEESVATLPAADVVVCLSLWHHLCRQLGFDAAREVLREVLQRTRRVCFFETGQSNEDYLAAADALPAMGDDPRAWLEAFLLECGGRRVKHLGEFETHLGTVRRHLFAVHTDA